MLDNIGMIVGILFIGGAAGVCVFIAILSAMAALDD